MKSMVSMAIYYTRGNTHKGIDSDFGLRGLIDHFCSALAHTKHLRLLICI
ncbi:MAG: hypothetical protein QNL13_00110 [Oceanospirillaceae bacterium]